MNQAPALLEARFHVGDRIPGRVTRVKDLRLEERDGRTFVVYVLSDRIRRRHVFRLIEGGNA